MVPVQERTYQQRLKSCYMQALYQLRDENREGPLVQGRFDEIYEQKKDEEFSRQGWVDRSLF